MPDPNTNPLGGAPSGLPQSAPNPSAPSAKATAPSNLPTGGGLPTPSTQSTSPALAPSAPKPPTSGASPATQTSLKPPVVSAPSTPKPSSPSAVPKPPTPSVPPSQPTPSAPPPKPPVIPLKPPKIGGPVSGDRLSQLFSDSDEPASPASRPDRPASTSASLGGSASLQSSLGVEDASGDAKPKIPDEGYAVAQDLLNERLDAEQTISGEELPSRGGMKSIITVIAIVIAVLSIGVSAGIFMWYSSMLSAAQSSGQELQEELDSIQFELDSSISQISSLETTVSDLEAELAAGATCPISDNNGAVFKEPKAGWEIFFPTGSDTTLAGNMKSEVESKIGKAPIVVKDLGAAVHKEVWIYLPAASPEDGLYIYFSDDEVVKGGLETFTGLISKCPIIGF